MGTRFVGAAFVVVLIAVGAVIVANRGIDPNGSLPSAESHGVTATEVANPYEQERTAGVTRLLDQWASATRSDDEPALRKLFDPDASPQFVESEVARAHNLVGVPLSDWGYDIVPGPETPVPPSIAEPLGAADVWAPGVSLRYSISGADSAPTRRPVSLVVARRGDEWKLVSDADLTDFDRHTWRGPWDFGPVISRTVATGSGSTSVVLGHPQQAQLIDNLAAELPSAVAAVSDFWGPDWPRGAVVETASTPQEFASLVDTSGVGSSVVNPDVAAETISDALAPGATTATGQRVIFGDAASTQLTPLSLRSVLRHELTHVAARTKTVDGSPLWVLEGVADYSGYRNQGLTPSQIAPTLAKIVAVGGPPRVLPSDADFAAGGTRATLAYESAWSVWAFVAAEFGEPKVKDLYLALSTGPRDAQSLDKQLEESTGLIAAEFIARWGQWVASNTV